MTETEDKPARKPKDFNSHLAGLYEFYGPKLNESIDPPEVILSGMARTDPCELTFDQLILLNLACMHELAELAESKEKIDRLTFNDKVGAFVDWLRRQDFEMQVMTLRQAGQTPGLSGAALKAVLQNFPEFEATMKQIAPGV
jgi:hypothetical protein